MPHLIDSHAHLTFDQKTDTKNILKRAKDSNVSHIINICTDKQSLLAGETLIENNNWIYNAAGIPPQDVEEIGAAFLPIIEKYAKEKKIVAVGEIGLDYYYKTSSKEKQIFYFQKQLDIAKKYSLPIIIHCREAFTDLFSIIQPYLPLNAVLHCFTGTEEEATKVLDMGFYISFSGIITFKNSKELQEIVKTVPLERMLIETDSPFLAPQKYRGKRNEPSYLIETAEKISELKNIDVKEVISKTTSNSTALFSLT